MAESGAAESTGSGPTARFRPRFPAADAAVDAQATFDTFSADLAGLSDSEVQLDDEIAEAGDMEVNVDGDLADIESLNYDDLDSVSKLQRTQRYADIMQKVEDALHKGSDSVHGTGLEDNPEYQLIVDCNALLVDIENELIIIHNFIRDNYRLKFRELESLVRHPIDYSRVVKQIGNEMDLTLVDLEGLLPSAGIMVISVTASTTSGKPLPEEIMRKTIDACDRALALDSATKKVLDFMESRMGYIAPNLSVPYSEPKKKRGGRRLRKLKERYAVTDMRKLANRMRFGVPEESSLGY